MVTECSIEDLRKDMIKKFRDFSRCEGSGMSWIHKREDLWMRYVVSREVYMRAMCNATGNPYRPPNIDFDYQMKRFIEKTSH